MSEGLPPEPPLFSKRSRRVQKRRRTVSHLSGPGLIDAPTSATAKSGTVTSSNASLHVSPSGNEELPTIQDPTRSRPYSLRIKPRVETKLKQAPVVPGYEPESDRANEKHNSYTEEQLKQLKQKLRISPQSRQPEPKSGHEPPLHVPKDSTVNQSDTSRFAFSKDKGEQITPSSEKSRLPLFQPPQPTTTKQTPSTAAAAPFSAEWNARIYDEDDIQAEPVSNFSRTEPGDGDCDSADAEWEAQLMRRAAQKTDQQHQFMLRREMNIIRDVEMEKMHRGAFKKLKAEIGKRIDELAEEQAFVEQKIERLGQVVRQDTEIEGSAGSSVENIRRKVMLYEDLVQRISTVSRGVAGATEVFERWESFVDNEMKESIRQVSVWLKGGIDKFGRERKAQIQDIEEIRDKLQEWGGRLVRHENKEVIELREELNFKEMTRLVKRWRESFPEEYNSACADATLGKLLGRLALLENDIGFVHKLDEREEMIKTAITAFGAERFAAWIKARWEPRLSESCEFVGDLLRRVNAATEEAKSLVRSALQARLALEVEALEAMGDGGTRQVMQGLEVIGSRAGFTSAEALLPQRFDTEPLQ